MSTPGDGEVVVSEGLVILYEELGDRASDCPSPADLGISGHRTFAGTRYSWLGTSLYG